jgi:hypothetical protein
MSDVDWWPGDTLVYGRDECFLCGAPLTPVTRTWEHVFPQWILREFDVWEARLTLLNGTDIPYSQLKIPCCLACNGGLLATIERTVATAYRSGIAGFRALGEETLFLWLGKILYGLLVRELHLPADRRDPEAGMIVEPDDLQQFQMHHYLLQGAVRRVRWGTFPASIFLFDTKTSDDAHANFDFSDGPHGPFLSLRIGGVGIFAVLQDWGAARNTLELTPPQSLAPVQFRELSAFMRYYAYRFKRTPTILVGKPADGPAEVTCLPLGGLSGGPLYDPFEPEAFAAVLGHALDVPAEWLLIDGRIRTWMTNDQGEAWDLPFQAWPLPPES